MNVAELLADLIGFPSVSSQSNVDVTRHLAGLLVSLNFEVEEVPYTDRHGVEKLNVVARRSGLAESDRGGFAYFAHTDVVPAVDWTGPGGAFESAQQDGRVYGRGSCDMKGSVAAMVTAAGTVMNHAEPVFIVLTADEEVGMRGAEEVATRSRLYREIVERDVAAVIGEPTSGKVVHGHKGYAVWTATAYGRAGHSSTRDGESATLKLMPFLATVAEIADELERDSEYSDDRYDPPTPTLNAIIRDAAPALNVTSPEASVQLFARVSTTFDPRPIDERLRAAAERCGVALSTMRTRPAFYRDAHDPFIGELIETLNAPAAETVSYGTDGSCLGDVHRLAVYGPGSIAQAHTSDEFITLADLERGVRDYAALIERFANR